MNNLSYTQEFFMCVVNEKGKTNNLPLATPHTTITLCLVVGGIRELIQHGFVAHDSDNLITAKPLDKAFSYLKPLYDDIACDILKKNIKSVAESFYAEYTTKHLDKLLLAIGEGLIEKGYAEALPSQGFLSKKIRYAPKDDKVSSIIEKIRTEFLGDGEISENTLSLAAMLDKSGVIEGYFDQDEMTAFHERIKEVRNSEKYALLKDVRKFYDSLDEWWLIG